MIVEYANDLIVTPGTCLANASFLREMLAFKKVPVYLEHTITEIGDGYVMVKPRNGGEPFKLECDNQRRPSYIKMTDVNNPDNVITVYGNTYYFMDDMSYYRTDNE
jgi:hypothetical protein